MRGRSLCVAPYSHSFLSSLGSGSGGGGGIISVNEY